jgi:pilus assembly protein CpaF
MGLDAERTQVRVIAEERVRELIRTRGIDPMRDHDAIRDAIEQTVADAVGEALASGEALRIDPVQLALEVQHAVAGFGPLQRFFDDPTVEEIWINEPGRVFVARAGRSELTTVVLTDREVRDLVERMLRISGRRLDTSSPFVDAMLPDGSRLHVVIPDITRRHWSVNVRRFVMRPRHIDDLVPAGTVSAQAAAFLSAAVVSGLNIVVAGGTQAGKTTLLSALLGCVPMHERIVSWECVKKVAPWP